MSVVRVDHPDILEFVDAKRSAGAFTNFNLSVAVTDRFMAATVADESYDLVHPRHRPVSRLRARAVFDAIVQAAWETGDPGLLYLVVRLLCCLPSHSHFSSGCQRGPTLGL